MTIDFKKYHGSGNDFILIDDRQENFPVKEPALITQLCDRHFGIGSDGLMLLRESDQADFEMIFFNPDGSKSLCGNGSRCAVRFSQERGLAAAKGSMLTTDGLHDYVIHSDREVAIAMRDVKGVNKVDGHWFIDTGSPHLIISMTDLDHLAIEKIGREWRNNAAFDACGGANVNFVAPTEEPDILEVRTYERGVERETLSCGTGVTAAALAHGIQHNLTSGAIRIRTRGGELEVSFDRADDLFTNIWLTGPVAQVYSGRFES